MVKTGLIFQMNHLPRANDKFLLKKQYRFIPEFSKKSVTIIEVEIYQHQICVISFFDKQNSGQKNRYRHRKNLGAGHALAIIKACLQVYHSLEEDYALIFSAANDIGQIEEDNARYSAYLKVIARYFKNIEQYNQQGSIKLNTLMLYHQSFQYKQEANQFYQEFEQQVEDNLVETDDEK